MWKNFKLNKFLLLIPLTSLMFCFNSQNDDEKMQTIMVSVKTHFLICIIARNLSMMPIRRTFISIISNW